MKRIDEYTWAEVKTILTPRIGPGVILIALAEMELKQWQEEQHTYTVTQEQLKISECHRLASQPRRHKRNHQENWADDLWEGL